MRDHDNIHPHPHSHSLTHTHAPTPTSTPTYTHSHFQVIIQSVEYFEQDGNDGCTLSIHPYSVSEADGEVDSVQCPINQSLETLCKRERCVCVWREGWSCKAGANL